MMKIMVIEVIKILLVKELILSGLFSPDALLSASLFKVKDIFESLHSSQLY